MGNAKGLSERHTRDGGGRSIFGDEAKKHDIRCKETSYLVLKQLKKTYPGLDIERWDKLYKTDIHKQLNSRNEELGIHQFRKESHIRPDGGIFVVKDKQGKWRVILVGEAKLQGSNRGRIERGLKKQATGNALERATKNIAEVRNFMIDENHFPYVIFGHGEDLTEKEIKVTTKTPLTAKAEYTVGTVTTLKLQTIPDRITSANYGLECNTIHVHNHWVTRSDGRETMLQPASLFMRYDPWTNEEMYDIMMEIATISIHCLAEELPKV